MNNKSDNNRSKAAKPKLKVVKKMEKSLSRKSTILRIRPRARGWSVFIGLFLISYNWGILIYSTGLDDLLSPNVMIPIDIVFHTLRISIGVLLILMCFGNSLTIAIVDGKKVITKRFLWFAKQYLFDYVGISAKKHTIIVYSRMTKEVLFKFVSNKISVKIFCSVISMVLNHG
jgi:hypothetical protein